MLLHHCPDLYSIPIILHQSLFTLRIRVPRQRFPSSSRALDIDRSAVLRAAAGSGSESIELDRTRRLFRSSLAGTCRGAQLEDGPQEWAEGTSTADDEADTVLCICGGWVSDAIKIGEVQPSMVSVYLHPQMTISATL